MALEAGLAALRAQQEAADADLRAFKQHASGLLTTLQMQARKHLMNFEQLVKIKYIKNCFHKFTAKKHFGPCAVRLSRHTRGDAPPRQLPLKYLLATKAIGPFRPLVEPVKTCTAVEVYVETPRGVTVATRQSLLLYGLHTKSLTLPGIVSGRYFGNQLTTR